MKKSLVILFAFVLLIACSRNSSPPTPTPVDSTPTPEVADTAVATAVPTSPSTTVPPATTTGQVSGTATDALNIRSGPGITFPVVGSLKQGDTVTITGKSADGIWWKIDKGWVSSTYIQVAGDGSALPVATP